jgi:hypothetical protein
LLVGGFKIRAAVARHPDLGNLVAQVTLVAVSRTRKHLESPWAAAAATVPVVFNAREISLEDVDSISPGIRDILLAVLPNKEVR